MKGRLKEKERKKEGKKEGKKEIKKEREREVEKVGATICMCTFFHQPRLSLASYKQVQSLRTEVRGYNDLTCR